MNRRTLSTVLWCSAVKWSSSGWYSRKSTRFLYISWCAHWFIWLLGCKCLVRIVTPNHSVETAHHALDTIDRAGEVTCRMSCCVTCNVYTGNAHTLKLCKNRKCIFDSNVCKIDVGMFPDTGSINIFFIKQSLFLFLFLWNINEKMAGYMTVKINVFHDMLKLRYFIHCFFIILSHSWHPWIINRSSNLGILNFLKMGSVCAINLLLSINRTAFLKFK